MKTSDTNRLMTLLLFATVLCFSKPAMSETEPAKTRVPELYIDESLFANKAHAQWAQQALEDGLIKPSDLEDVRDYLELTDKAHSEELNQSL